VTSQGLNDMKDLLNAHKITFVFLVLFYLPKIQFPFPAFFKQNDIVMIANDFIQIYLPKFA